MRRMASHGGPVLLLAAVWIVLARGGAGWVWAGVLAVATAAWVYRRSADPGDRVGLRWSRMAAVLVLFVTQSLRGGFDVAWRILLSGRSFRPGYTTVPLTLGGESPRVLLVLLTGLMPGTLAARLEGDRLTVHALDTTRPIEEDIRRMERAVAGLFTAERASA